MNEQVRFDKWWGRAVGVFVLFFMGWFVVKERNGFQPVGDLLVGGIAAIPDALGNIMNYYTSVPFGALIGSMAVGAIFGAFLTVIVYWSANDLIEFPTISQPPIWYGLFAVIALVFVGQSLAVIIAALVVIVLLASLFYDFHEWRLFVTGIRPHLSAPTARKWAMRGLLFGAVAGAVGSQTLVAPIRHCTYTSDVDNLSRILGIAITLAGTLVVLIPVWTFTLRRGGRKVASHSGYFRGWLLPVVSLTPTLLILLVFLYYPSFQIAANSLVRARRRQEPTFQCLDNFSQLLQDPVYQSSFTMTLLITLAIVILGMVIALLIALLASQKIRGASIYRTLLIWPYALSPVVTATIFISMFRDDSSGLINYALIEIAGRETVRWLTDASIAPWVLILAAVYNILGFNIIFYIAGLQNVPKDLLEAGQIDGANLFQRFFRITIPLLSPYTFFLLVANITYSFYGIYGVIDTLFPGGGPLMADGQSRAVNVLIYKLYEDSFRSSTQIGETAAQALILFTLVASITLIQFRYVESQVTYAD